MEATSGVEAMLPLSFFGEDSSLPLRLLFLILRQDNLPFYTHILLVATLIALVVLVGYFAFEAFVGKKDKFTGVPLLGEEGEVTKVSGVNRAWVFVQGEYWKCFCVDKLEVGDRIRVTKKSKMLLDVEKIKE